MDSLCDVAIVGYGPVGRLLAVKLGRRGHSVVVIERQKTNYFLPRAVHLDDEACRILQSVGLRPDAMPDAITPYEDFYEWRNANGEVLLNLDWRGRGDSGWNVSNFFNQPQVERALDLAVRDLANVTLVNGHKVVAFAENDDSIELTLEGGQHRSVSARYVVGADGANSVVRQWIGGSTTDLGYFHDWIVIDLLMKTSTIRFEPPAYQVCDPARPTTLVPGGPGRRRFEFMLLPGETRQAFAEESAIWQLLEPWGIGPNEAELERNVVYTFQARWSDTWRKGRLLLAGDAAHLMPPFAGQGMCSGLRDAVNLEWKLDRVLRDAADASILDSYGSERTEHVRHFIEASMQLGEIICISDPDDARERDTAMKAELAAGVRKPPRPLPSLGRGMHRGDRGGGLLSVQGRVDSEAGTALFDDAVGSGPVLLLDAPELRKHLDSRLSADLERDGVRVIALDSVPGPGCVVDIDATYERWLATLSARAVMVRPDFYVHGIAETESEIEPLATSYLTMGRVDVSA